MIARKGMVRRALIATISVWVLIVVGSFLWNLRYERTEENRIALSTARAFFSQVLITRDWVSLHGGVYVAATEETPPNPYLEDPKRDIPLPDGRMLTKINPSYMTRQLSEMAERLAGIRFHLTSLKPIRPQNAPDDWERRALEAFELGEKEIGEFQDETTYRYMAPLIVEPSCLPCHARQGYRAGDIRGGLRITLPNAPRMKALPLLGGHLLIGAVGLGFITILGLRLGRAYETLRGQAVLDTLTNIYNRRYFFDRFVQEIRRAKRGRTSLALILCDIDYFKQFNDLYGHLAGDDCLKSVVQTIQTRLRRGGDIFARYGGEEFIALLPETDEEGAKRIAEEIIKAIQDLKIPHARSSVSPWVSISIGVTVLEKEETATENELVQQADTALYRAKSRGRNRVEIFGADYHEPVPPTEIFEP